MKLIDLFREEKETQELNERNNMDARVSVSKETIKKAETISNKRKGELRAQKLHEVAESGQLQKAKARVDVAMMCGFTEKQKPAGYAWVASQVKKGILVERLSGHNPYTNQPEYEYSLGTPRVKLDPTKTLKEEKKEEERVVSMYGIGNTTTMVAIRVGEISVEITGAPVDYAKAIIETIIKK